MKNQVTELGAYRMLVEQAHDLISAHTTDDRTVFLYASNAFQRVLGISTEDLLGVQLIHLVHPDDAGRVTEALPPALLCNQVTQVVVYRLRHQQQEFTVESSFRVVPTKLVAITRVGGPGVAILP
ncbi:multi-sensor hybrid histidine kinase [Ectocarpus siliculosus]|uniref:Multi-sensor hybrid histidine kinase n=1 Tax=Ectocarpus siliculosus TaxID=2880 RepID=D7G032_ECTSI|nr:multi-sensor hybrid histidine kinase [Ectocarpus siliculosus]|eukprot:CBJ32914.1 multi-sensor hybrid histidine kinase [Ectocarpus siliculosus]